MARLLITLHVDVDPTLEDPEDVANDLMYDERLDNNGLRQYAECETTLVEARWAE